MEEITIEDLGISGTQLERLFTEKQYEDFINFMVGQTVGVIDGKSVYYYGDVSLFIQNLIQNNTGEEIRSAIWD